MDAASQLQDKLNKERIRPTEPVIIIIIIFSVNLSLKRDSDHFICIFYMSLIQEAFLTACLILI
jgi:hypothetical protein